jgi:hypothetical protein
LWSPLLLSPVSASVKLAYEVFQMTKTNWCASSPHTTPACICQNITASGLSLSA